MKLRRAGEEDAGLLAAIHATAFAPEQAWPERTMRTLVTLPGVMALLAEEEGLLLLRQAADEAEVLTLAVRPEARRRGVAMALMETGLVLLSAGGARRMLLEVAAENTAALALYTGLGFTRAGERRDYFGPGRHAWLLGRDLGGEG
jgi:ribosomal-protein-alanine N-acetyltransferase